MVGYGLNSRMSFPAPRVVMSDVIAGNSPMYLQIAQTSWLAG